MPHLFRVGLLVRVYQLFLGGERQIARKIITYFHIRPLNYDFFPDLPVATGLIADCIFLLMTDYPGLSGTRLTFSRLCQVISLSFSRAYPLEKPVRMPRLPLIPKIRYRV